MPDKTEKSERKKVLHAIREEKRSKARDSLPVPASVLKALFDYVDSQLKSVECDNTLRHTLDFIRGHGLPEKAVIQWLEDNHGYCDCETLMNSEEVVEDAVPGYRDMEPTTNLS